METAPVVCVTGASAGIGRAIALAFAADRELRLLRVTYKGRELGG